MPVLAVTRKRTLIAYSRHKYSFFGPWSNVRHQELSPSSGQQPIFVSSLESGNEQGTKAAPILAMPMEDQEQTRAGKKFAPSFQSFVPPLLERGDKKFSLPGRHGSNQCSNKAAIEVRKVVDVRSRFAQLDGRGRRGRR